VGTAKKILIVDDDRIISMALGVRLKRAGYEVSQATDGLQAMMQASRVKPDLVVLDLGLPAGGGLAVAERLRGLISSADVPIVFITGSADASTKAKARSYDPVALLEKPFGEEVLVDVVRKALGDAGGQPAPR
jgi:DNA-binding response OmpR family regulator